MSNTYLDKMQVKSFRLCVATCIAQKGKPAVKNANEGIEEWLSLFFRVEKGILKRLERKKLACIPSFGLPQKKKCYNVPEKLLYRHKMLTTASTIWLN